MGISPEKFLNLYFTLEQLKTPLEDIGLATGGTKNQKIQRIIENWTVYHRDWYELLNYLEWGDLSRICDDFNIKYSDYNTDDTLCNKIEDEQVLDFRNKQKKKLNKESVDTPTINIGEQHINIGSNNKINSENKINSDNTFYSNLSDNKRKMFILGVIAILVAIIVPIGIAMYQSYESSMENWNDPNSSESPDVITNDISGNDNIVIIGDGNIVMDDANNKQFEYAEINSTLNVFLLELQKEKIFELTKRVKELEHSLSQSTDEDERMKLEDVIYKLTLATKSIQEEDFLEAERYYRLILSNDENNVDALEGLAYSLGRQDKSEESIFYYDKVLGFKPDYYEALINNAWSFVKLKEYEESLKILNQLEDKDHNDLLVLSHKCWVLHKLNLHESAIEYCKKVLIHGTDDERVPRAYSLSLSLLGRSEEALPFHKQLYEKHPDELPIIINYANTLSDVGQIQEALNIYDKGLEKFPDQVALEHNKKALCANNPQLQCE